MIQFANVAAQLCGAGVAVISQPAPAMHAGAVALPSDDLERARPRILLTSFVVNPGPKLEALMRSAAFLGTESKYDI